VPWQAADSATLLVMFMVMVLIVGNRSAGRNSKYDRQTRDGTGLFVLRCCVNRTGSMVVTVK
jgi:hypothetical protein